ncbi:MAG TPA: hypothetical protein VIV11_24890 [Kofleriaceae bacterium]
MTRRYPVRPKTGTMVLCALFFGVCALVLFWQALTNQRGLVIEGIFHLGPGGARVFYGVLCALSLGFVVIAIVVLVIYAGKTHEVVVDDDSLTTPGPLWRLNATRTARFADVTKVREQKMSGQHFLTLVTPSSKVWIAKGHLPDGAFDEIVAFVRQRLGARAR